MMSRGLNLGLWFMVFMGFRVDFFFIDGVVWT